MNTNLEIEEFALKEVKSHYERMVKSRPYFCDMLYWMGRDKKSDNEILKKRKEATISARETLASNASRCHCTSLNVLDNELKEMWERMVIAHIDEKELKPNPEDSEEEAHNKYVTQMESWAQVCDKAFDSIAVLLRIVDVIRNRQVLGRPS